MSAAVVTTTGAASSTRLLADVRALANDVGLRPSAHARLEAALGRELAEQVLAELADEPAR